MSSCHADCGKDDDCVKATASLGHGRHRLPAVLLRVVRLDGGKGGLPVRAARRIDELRQSAGQPLSPLAALESTSKGSGALAAS